MQLTRADVIAAAVAYADIFDYPLTEKELRTWLLFYVFKRPRLVIVQGEALRRLKRVCVASVVYYGLRRVNQLVKVRRQRIIWSKKKMLTAQTISWWFRLVPTIMLVGVTGGLAMANAKKEDDIDLFFVTQKGTLWISRLLTTVIAELLGVRR
ncbi:hypothetical protein HY950_03800, partial [Candidatus Gottesmanbacteria bacterium]|nr:hypothetical protein [Candidatus Gottesmanbacteria bacterium]